MKSPQLDSLAQKDAIALIDALFQSSAANRALINSWLKGNRANVEGGALPELVKPADLLSMSALARIFNYNPESLRQLVVQGRLKAWNVSGMYVTTQENVRNYLASRKRTPTWNVSNRWLAKDKLRRPKAQDQRGERGARVAAIRRRALLEFIQKQIAKNERAPTHAEMAEFLGVSFKTTTNYVAELLQMGLITLDDGKSRSMKLTAKASAVLSGKAPQKLAGKFAEISDLGQIEGTGYDAIVRSE